jgi:hypothetical protein
MFSLAGWGLTYFLFKKREGYKEGLYFMNTLNKDVYMRFNKWHQSSLVKSIGKMSAPNVEVEQKIYIAIPHRDELMYKNNLYSKRTPKMVARDQDMPFLVNIKNYEKDDYFKFRIVAKEDWGQVDWKTGELIDPTAE